MPKLDLEVGIEIITTTACPLSLAPVKNFSLLFVVRRGGGGGGYSAVVVGTLMRFSHLAFETFQKGKMHDADSHVNRIVIISDANLITALSIRLLLTIKAT